jgi:hypothetical protein
MFNRQTIFIVGAGASAEVDFPIGTQLARQICAKMDIRFERGDQQIGTGDYDLFFHITRSRPREGDQFQSAAWRICEGLPFAQSIDDFLDQHRTDGYVNLYGKAAIVQAVLEAERNSRLFFNRVEGAETFDAEKLTDTWFTKFMYMLCRGIPREDVSELFEKVAFIVFNYDRCIEHFLIHAVQRAYSIPFEDAASIVGKINIVRPYGSVGDLSKVSFGSTRVNAIQLAAGIKTYTEQVGAADITEKLTAELNRAEHIVFLGFAFHSQNVGLLRANEARPRRAVYGTILGMSDPDRDEVRRQLAMIMRPTEINLEKLKCTQLFDHFAKSLTGGG